MDAGQVGGKYGARTHDAGYSAFGSNLGALSRDIVSFERINLEIVMAFDLSTSLRRRVPMHDRRNSSDIAFIVWTSIILTGLAIVAIALGVAPVPDPTSVSVP